MKNIITTFLWCLATTLSASWSATAQTAPQLENEAWKAYERGYHEDPFQDKAAAFDQAAELFHKAAEAWRNAGNEEKAKDMERAAKAARDNAAARRQMTRHAVFATLSEGLTGAGFKIRSIPQNHTSPETPATTIPRIRPRFRAGISLSFGGQPSPNYVSGQAIADTFGRNVFSDPQVFAQIFERLGGEFVPGLLTGHPLLDVEMPGETQMMPGASLHAAITPVLEFGITGHYFQSQWSGYFPITVFPLQAPEIPRTEMATISASVKGMLADLSLRYILHGKVLRPYIEGGVRGQYVFNTTSGMELAGQRLPFEMRPTANAFSPYAGAGIRLHLGRRAFLQAEASFGKWPGAEYMPGGGVELGWRF